MGTSFIFASLLAFLAPLAIYCWVLTAINRRARPTMVSGLWDCAGLLLAASGILLVLMPFLLYRLFWRLMNELPPQEDTLEGFAQVLDEWWVCWALYFSMIVALVVLLLWRRRSKTVIYNVDPEMFRHVLRDCRKDMGGAEPDVEVFPSLCNVSLDWPRAQRPQRTVIENRLGSALKEAAPLDNPAANWFMGTAGLLFGMMCLTAMVWFLTAYFPRRW